MQQEPSDGVTTTSEEMEDIRDDEPASTAADLPADTSHGAGSTTGTPQQVRRFDWPAVGMVVILGAIFAALGHLSAQPYTSLVPAAVLSATGCGLLITGTRKLRTFKGVGIGEAALSGLLLALLQFGSALSFPGVTRGLSIDPGSQAGFFCGGDLFTPRTHFTEKIQRAGHDDHVIGIGFVEKGAQRRARVWNNTPGLWFSNVLRQIVRVGASFHRHTRESDFIHGRH